MSNALAFCIAIVVSYIVYKIIRHISEAPIRYWEERSKPTPSEHAIDFGDISYVYAGISEKCCRHRNKMSIPCSTVGHMRFQNFLLINYAEDSIDIYWSSPKDTLYNHPMIKAALIDAKDRGVRISTHNSVKEMKNFFVVVDNIAFRFEEERVRGKVTKSRANYGDAYQAKMLNSTFEAIWRLKK